MFNRTRSESTAATPQATNAPWPEPANPQAGPTGSASALDRLLDDLGAGAPQQVPGESSRDTADMHTDTLRATRDAHQRAQALFALAAEARSDATEQAEQLVEEARVAADRIREEAQRDADMTRHEVGSWATKQRAKVEVLVEDVVASARTDAERIRTEAMHGAMSDAEQSARRYVEDAMAQGGRDAEAIRDEARNLLRRASLLARGVQEDARALTERLAESVARVRDESAQIDQLLTETQQDLELPPVLLPPLPPEADPTIDTDIDTDIDTAAGQQPCPLDSSHPLEETDGEEAGREEDSTEKRTGQTGASDQSGHEHPGRQLGSMFRRPDQGN